MLELADGQFTLWQGGARSAPRSVLDLGAMEVTPGFFWARIQFPGANIWERITLDGIPNDEAAKLQKAVRASIESIEHKQKLALLSTFDQWVTSVTRWASDFLEASHAELTTRGWLSRTFIERVDATRPTNPGGLLDLPEARQRLSSQPQDVQSAVRMWQQGVADEVHGANHRHLAHELERSRDFLNKVEKSPLTDEQAKAVICFDERILLVASAGSGKTSTMVAKAGYALKKGYFKAEEVLLLAFNSDAADELGERVRQRLKPLGLPAGDVQAKTFHAFGLDVIGSATGKKPSLAAWLEAGQDLAALQGMVDALRDRDASFRTEWDLFRLVLGKDLPKFGKEHLQPEAWDRDSAQAGFWTLNNEVVKSRGEQLIANWLFYNGVDYHYEGSYEVDTANPTHRQYRPDFYIPAANAYLEHWAVDADGRPPAAFKDYEKGMAWKRQVHKDNQTTLLETTMADLWSGKAFGYLAKSLERLGVKLDPNPDREVRGRKPIENPRLVRTFRTFLTHAKSNRLSVVDLQQRSASGAAGDFRYRHEMFLRLFEKLRIAWDERLRADKCIDFDDMLNLAADCVEQGRWQSPYRLIMVDEFQDASQARARLLAALVAGPGRYLFAVGDDWQSINRFAGADLAVMTDFEARFGVGTTLRLETTFRCSKSLCDISSTFVQQNPRQLKKTVRSTNKAAGEAIQVIRVADQAGIVSAVTDRVAEIAAGIGRGGKARVLVLGRYNRDRVYMPARYDSSKLAVDFITVHSSKGLEADYVILPRMTSEALGFPSGVADDPVLQLAMPSGDSFEHAEERRLFYVALTRARFSVTLITMDGRESPFVTELVAAGGVDIRDAEGGAVQSEVCPTCGQGFLAQRKGRYGEFYGCSTFPRCNFTRNVTSPHGTTRRSVRTPFSTAPKRR
jgi:DNA helicase-4